MKKERKEKYHHYIIFLGNSISLSIFFFLKNNDKVIPKIEQQNASR
jgi:hypothetical protein